MEPRPKPSRLLLLRHPETDWNREGRWQGHADLPINARGREQLREAVERLPPGTWAALYASDLARAREPAEWLGRRLGLPPRVMRALRERRMGAWEGLTQEEARAGWPGEHERVEADPLRERPPGGESFADLLDRVRPALEEIAARHSGEAALIVTHGGILKALVCTLIEIDFTRRDELGLANAVQVLFEVAGPRWTLRQPAALAVRQSRYELYAEALR